jgi:predicted dehydrogenase
VVSQNGVSGLHAGRKYGFSETTTDTARVLESPAIDAVVIASRHSSHADLAARALAAGKHVFVEKPLAISLPELAAITHAFAAATEEGRVRVLMVGFNRRFAPHVRKLKELLAAVKEPKAFVATINAGAIPRTHWTQDSEAGGGRIIGEGCHFVDLLRFLAGSAIVGFDAISVGRTAGTSVTDDKASITLRFADGSIGTILYLANGHKSFPKERIEVFVGGRVLQLDNFRKLTGFGWPGFKSLRLWRQDKGQRGCAAAFVDALRNGRPSPIPFDELLEVSRVAIEVGEALR